MRLLFQREETDNQRHDMAGEWLSNSVWLGCDLQGWWLKVNKKTDCPSYKDGNNR